MESVSKNKGGRPRLGPERLRVECVTVRITEPQYISIKRAAKHARKTVARWIADAALKELEISLR